MCEIVTKHWNSLYRRRNLPGGKRRGQKGQKELWKRGNYVYSNRLNSFWHLRWSITMLFEEMMVKIILVLNFLTRWQETLFCEELSWLIVDPVSPLMPGVWAGGRAGCAWPVCVWANVSLVQPPPSVSRVNTSGDLRPVLEPHLPASRADNIQPAHLKNKRKIPRIII